MTKKFGNPNSDGKWVSIRFKIEDEDMDGLEDLMP